MRVLRELRPSSFPRWWTCILTILALCLPLLLVDIAAYEGGSFRRIVAPYNSLACSTVSVLPQYADRIQIKHCPSSDRAGVFVITHQVRRGQKTRADPLATLSDVDSLATGACQAARGPVYRIRITGAEILTLFPRAKGDSFSAEYQLYSRGLFHAEILQLYDDFSFCHNPSLNRDIFVGRHVWHVHAAAQGEIGPCNTTTGCPACPPVPAAVPLRGRWFANTSSLKTASLLRELERTHEFGTNAKPGPASSTVAMSVPIEASELRWQPLEECTVAPTVGNVAAWRSVCDGVGRTVCFAGDSQMRHTYAMANAILSKQTISVTGQTYRTIPASSWSRYIGLKFGEEVESADFKSCSRLLINIGQWPIGWPAGKRWTVDRVEGRASEMISTIHNKFPHLRGQISWLSTHPLGLLRNRLGNETTPPTDWRTDPYIIEQNEAMRVFASERNITYIDTFEILYPVSDLAYDGAHYLGTPGYWAAALVLNNVCQ
jgi:hypothetical protein